MVYSSPDQPLSFSSLAGAGGVNVGSSSGGPAVQVRFNGTGLHTIAGPVPFVNLDKTFTRNGANSIENIQTIVTINGKIVRSPTSSGNTGTTLTPAGTGVGVILGAAAEMTKLFSCDAGTLDIDCAGTGIHISGARVNSFKLNKSDDNWFFTADYEAILEFNEPGVSGSMYPAVKQSVDTWTIEQLDEGGFFANFNISSSGKAEYHNPQLGQTGAAQGSQGGQGSNATNNSLRVINIPQFKVTRRVSAVGFPSGLGSCGSGNSTAYLQAKKWVELRLNDAFKASPSISGNPSFGSSDNPAILTGFNIYLYNHLRTINFSTTEGSYDVNDTWLAMPTGIKYIEDYSLETSTDEKYIKTVRVIGKIKGLSAPSLSLMNSGSLTPSGMPPKISLSGFLQAGSGNLPAGSLRLDASGTGGAGGAGGGNIGSDAVIRSAYENALSGWVLDIKPYLYRRASVVINNGPDRNTTYIPTTASTPPVAPNNPIYCTENPLNIIPVSTSEGHDPRKGTINYNYEYNNRFVFISGVLNENFTINDTYPTDVVNEAFVLGRRLGPILQSLGTRTSAKRTLTVEISVVPPSSMSGFPMTSAACPLYTGGFVYTTITGMIEGLKPYGDRSQSMFGGVRSNLPGQVYVNQDTQNWNPVEGKYTRNIGWTYQPCSVGQSYADV